MIEVDQKVYLQYLQYVIFPIHNFDLYQESALALFKPHLIGSQQV